MNIYKRLADHFYEAGFLKRMVRTGQREYMEPDFTDTVASHTYRVAIIAWHLATMFEEADPNKAATMALFHDLEEVRVGDADWIMKGYVKLDCEKAQADQAKGLDDRFAKLVEEFEERETIEAKIVKDADTLEMILTLKELSYKGNKEADNWLRGINFDHESDDYNQLRYLITDEAKELGRAIYDTDPSNWWHHISTNKNL